MSESAPPSHFTLVAAGNTMFQRRPSTETDAGFHELLDVIRTADAAFVNVEAPIFEPTAYPVKQHVYSSYVTTERWLAEELRWMGFNVVSLANNHMSDWSPEAMEANSRMMDAAGVVPTGLGETLAHARAAGYLDTSAGRVGVISVDSSYEFGEFDQVQMAGNPHGEVRGRPGVNGLRWHTSYELDPARFDHLRDVHRALDLHRAGPETAHSSTDDAEDEFSFRGIRVRRGDAPRVHTACDPRDVQEIIRWVRTASSQTDYLIVSHHTHSAAGAEWELPADFAREFAHAVVDAGADVYVGHGYAPKGIELRNGRPIFHDVGWLARQDNAARRHPGDAYEYWGLDPNATPGEFADAREAARARATTAARRELVRDYARAQRYGGIARVQFEGDAVARVEMYPSMVSRDVPRHRRGTPARVHGEGAEEWFERLRRASEPFGTELTLEDGVARVRLPA